MKPDAERVGRSAQNLMQGTLVLGAPASLRPARVPRTRREQHWHSQPCATSPRTTVRTLAAHPCSRFARPPAGAGVRTAALSRTSPSCRFARSPASPTTEPLHTRIKTTGNRSTRSPATPATEPLRRNDAHTPRVLRRPPGCTPWPTAAHGLRCVLMLPLMSKV